MTHTAVSIPARPLLWAALASLVALMTVSVAFVAVGGGIEGVDVRGGAVHALPSGSMLALAKIVALVLVFHRIRHAHVYSLQWSSMFILLFIAEGTVRATSDPQPSAILGWCETGVATIYFAAVLAILRPLKRRAREDAGR